MKKFCERFFPLSKVQHIRKQVINFVQGEEEGIDQVGDRFNGLIEQGPKLGFSGEVLLHTFYFSLTPKCMQFVQMCAGGDLIEKTLTEAAQLLQKISKGAAMRRDWEKRCLASSEEESQVRVLAGIFRKEISEVREEQPKHGKVIETNHDEEASIRSSMKDDPERKGKEEPWAPPNR